MTMLKVIARTCWRSTLTTHQYQQKRTLPTRTEAYQTLTRERHHDHYMLPSLRFSTSIIRDPWSHEECNDTLINAPVQKGKNTTCSRTLCYLPVVSSVEPPSEV